MLASPLRLEACSFDLDPSVLLNVEEKDVVEDCRRLATSNHAEVVLVNYSSGMSSARFWRLLTRHRWEKPDSRSDIEHEHIVEELARIASTEHVEAPFGTTLRKVQERMTSPWSRYRH